MSTNNNKHDDDAYIPPKNPKPSPLFEFVKFVFIIGLVVFVSFFMYCAVQLGEIGN